MRRVIPSAEWRWRTLSWKRRPGRIFCAVDRNWNVYGSFLRNSNKQKKYAVVSSHVSKNGKASCTIGGQRVGPLLRDAGRELGSVSKTGEFEDCRIRPPTQGTLSHHGPKENAIFHPILPQNIVFSVREK